MKPALIAEKAVKNTNFRVGLRQKSRAVDGGQPAALKKGGGIMPYKLSRRSKKRLAGVHPDLRAVVERALRTSQVDFTVLEGLRTTKQQEHLIEVGKSKSMNSRHLTGHAVDIVPVTNGQVSVEWPLYDEKLAPAIKQAAAELNVQIEWGGDWKDFRDGPHWQLTWENYPKSEYDASAKAPKIVRKQLNSMDSGQVTALIAGAVGIGIMVNGIADIIENGGGPTCGPKRHDGRWDTL